MYLKNLSLTNFRSFQKLDVSLPKGTILIEGDNAQGKTTILEAIYFLSTFTSFHTRSDRELINFIEAKNPLAVSRIKAEFATQSNTSHEIEVRIIQQQNNLSNPTLRKEVLIDGTKKRASQTIGLFSAVFFIPQMMRILDGSPSERRRYIDMAIAQTNPHYAPYLNQYNKLLTRKNATLKQIYQSNGNSADQLTYWNEQLSKIGAKIFAARHKAIEQIRPIAQNIFKDLTDHKEDFDIHYLPALETSLSLPEWINNEEQIEQNLLKLYQKNQKQEIYRGVTFIGPHRDEIAFYSNNLDLGKFGSRGQMRTTMLTLKMTEIEWIFQTTGQMPVLLLDEVLAELDKNRRDKLTESLKNFDQALLTTSEKEQFSTHFLENTTTWTIHQGMLTKNE